MTALMSGTPVWIDVPYSTVQMEAIVHHGFWDADTIWLVVYLEGRDDKIFHIREQAHVRRRDER